MMKKIKEVIVVEGTSDVQTLSNIIDADFIITHGSSLSLETLELIKSVNQTRGVIIFTDPDFPGEKIRKKIIEHIGNCKHAFIKPKDAKKKNKLGVAEANKEAILEALENVVSFDNLNKSNILNADLYELGLIGTPNSLENRIKVEEALSIGHGSAKTFLKRINMLNITKEKLIDILKEG